MRRVIYLMSGKAHMPYLLCSLYTLRQHWQGKVDVFAWPESIQIAEQIDEDTSLSVFANPREPKYRGKNDQFIDKIRLAIEMPSDDTVLYLDADTTIHGSLDPLFDAAEHFGFAATQFNEWTTVSNMMRSRIDSLKDYPEIDQRVIDKTLAYNWPSVNGGVWCCKPTSPVLPHWASWSLAASAVKGTYIADEKVLHLMQSLYSPDRFRTIQEHGKYNCSPVHQSIHLADKNVVIRHYHGDSNVRKDKSQKGWDLWWPIYLECIEKNIGNVQSWRAEAEQSNKWMRNLNKDLDGTGT